MKKVLMILTLLTGVVALAKNSPTEGLYGSYTNYCGYELVQDPRSGKDIVITYQNNPAYANHYCTATGLSELYRYDSKKDFYRVNHSEDYCILKAISANEITQVCYFSGGENQDQVRNSVRYYRYR